MKSFLRKLGRVVAAPVTLPIKAMKKAKENTMQAIVLGIARHALTAIGGSLVTTGYVGSSDAELLVGSLMAIVGIVMSVINKRKGA